MVKRHRLCPVRDVCARPSHLLGGTGLHGALHCRMLACASVADAAVHESMEMFQSVQGVPVLGPHHKPWSDVVTRVAFESVDRALAPA